MKILLPHRFLLRSLGFSPRSGWFAPSGRTAGSARLLGVALFCTGLVSAVLPRAQAKDFGALTTLYTFGSNAGDGALPSTALVQGNDGNFYGTTAGDVSPGTFFRVTPAGDLTTLHQFSATDGYLPAGALVQGSDGNFYGTTAGYSSSSGHGPNYNGTIYRITPEGAVTVLYAFTGGDDGRGALGLVQGSDGNFYGTTSGTLFRVTPAGGFTTLYTATGAAAYSINGSLVLGSDGNFYGTTGYGGASGDGTVFRFTPAGVVTTLHAFTGGKDGSAPLGGLVQAGTGAFYGTTSAGGKEGYGTIFKMTHAGALTTIYNFTGGADGESPESSLVRGSDGNFYGTTPYGTSEAYNTVFGSVAAGTVFQLTPADAFTTLYVFGTVSGDGNYPSTPLVQGSDGSFYGTTTEGGTGYSPIGTIFKMTVLPTPTAAPILSDGASTLLLGQTFEYLVKATNGPQSFGATGLPAGLSIDAVTGMISGVPSQTGTISIGLSATNGVGTGTATLTLTVNAQPVITSPASVSGQVGVPFSYQIAANNSPMRFGASGLPAGLALTNSATGLIAGTPTYAGTFAVLLDASSPVDTAQTTLTLVIAPAGSSSHPAFFTGESALENGVYYLVFPDGNYFGFYSFLSDANYLYHFDLGYEYVIDAADGKNGVYFYDFASGDFFYTSPSFPFPYLYDFGLNSVVYYYPDLLSAGHYTSNPRYFYDFATGQILTR